MAPQAHALLGASSAHRWLTCPPSARLEEKVGVPDKGSVYAEEGTVAHEYAEIELSNRIGAINNRSRANRMKKIKASEFWCAEMEEAIGGYCDYVMETCKVINEQGEAPYIELEQRVDYSEYVPEGFGTADVVIIAGDTLHVIDLKYGKGVPVSAEGNPQLRLYALGALLKFGLLFDIDRVKMTINQPRLGSVSTDEISAEGLLAWAQDVVKPAAELAYKGEGDFHPGEEACRWCRAKAACRARADEAITTAMLDFATPAEDGTLPQCDAANPPSVEEFDSCSSTPEALTVDEISRLLPILPRIEAWAKDVQDWALEQARDHGVRFAGYKLVEGRSTRKITDEEGAIAALEQAGYEDTDYLKPKALNAIGGLEKLLGKARFEEVLGEFVTKPAGKPALVSDDDKRPEIGSAEGAAADFAEAAA